MSDEMIKAEEENALITAASEEERQLLKAMAPAVKFLPYINLAQSTSKITQGKDPKAKPGDLTIASGQNIDVLGEYFDCLVLAMRFKAVEIVGDDTFNFYDRKSPEFNRVKEMAEQGGMNGNMCGPEFLLYLTDSARFATFFLSSPTLKQSGEDFLAAMEHQRHLKVKNNFIEGKKHNWWGLELKLNPVKPTNEPSESELVAEITNFKNPKSTDAEKSDDSSSDNTGRVV